MKAFELLQPLFEGVPLPECEIDAVTERADRANAYAVFVCIRGFRHDGHDHAATAYEKGCRIFVAERSLSLPDDACVLEVPDTRRALALLACRFYGDPSRKLCVIGITGTKGKTTTATMLAKLLNASGIPCGYIGTNGIQYLQTERITGNTTPDAITLQSTLSDMHRAGVKAVVLEVSSQALMQERVTGIHFDTVMFSNLYLDHVGVSEHPDFAHYRACKHRLFTDFDARLAVWNEDDGATPLMKENCSAMRSVGISLCKDTLADYTASNVDFTRDPRGLGMRFWIHTDKESLPASLHMVGLHNVSNALMALAVANVAFGIALTDLIPIMEHLQADGRAECIPLPCGALCVIDYAHNGESLRALLTSLCIYRPRRLICLFGSVGERSQLRRAELGEVAAELADLSILTADNPGCEDVEAIIREIARPIETANKPYWSYPDRAEAIRAALCELQDGDVLVLAGKGHERYQLIGDQKIPFCEKSIVTDWILQSTHAEMV